MPRPRGKLLVALALALVASVRGFVPAATSSARPAAAPALFGMNVPSLEALDESESALGARAALIGTYSDWAHAPDFPGYLARRINARGAVPLISWEPWDSWRGGADQPAYALRRIADGAHDALIDRWAAQIAAFHRPVMLRFAAEMNGDWLPWSTGVNGNADGDYVAAWRHVRARFRRAGATNAVWVWNPAAAYEGSTPLRELFPGRRQVDWLAVDGFNWGATRPWGWQSYSDVLAPTVGALRRLAPGRPVMIAETGCPPDPRKASWVSGTLNAARAAGVDALVWFEFDKETDWRLSESEAVTRSARAVITTRAWRTGGDLAAVERAVRR
jgi:Glycosyl hydrolase family 26